MKKMIIVAIMILASLFSASNLMAQCSLCTKTAQQLGDGPAHGFNTGIIYLAFLPITLIAILGIRWWRNEKKNPHS